MHEDDQLAPALYAAYLTGVSGNGFALLFIGNGRLVGVDGATSKYDGAYTLKADGSLSCGMSYTIPGNTPLITGHKLGEDTSVSISFLLPPEFSAGKVVRLETPTGVVNMRLEKLREI